MFSARRSDLERARPIHDALVIVVLLGLLGLLASFVLAGQAGAAEPAFDAAPVRAAVERWNRALNERDAKKLARAALVTFELEPVADWLFERFEVEQDIELGVVKPVSPVRALVSITGSLRLKGARGLMRFVRIDKAVDTEVELEKTERGWRVARLDQIIESWLE